MAKFLTGFLGFLLCVSIFSASAQESVGFSDPANLEPLLDYRLPEWGYSNFRVDLNFSDSESHNKSSGIFIDPVSFAAVQTALFPLLTGFQEPELRSVQRSPLFWTDC